MHKTLNGVTFDPCPFCGEEIQVDILNDGDALAHCECIGFETRYFKSLELLAQSFNWGAGGYSVRTDYDAIRYQPGLYWAQGVDRITDGWGLRIVKQPGWTQESGKDHCLWYWADGSGEGEEIETGEWFGPFEPPT